MPAERSATPLDRPGPSSHKRTYQACTPCRTAKIRCDLGNPDAPAQPPCKRCRRTGRDCAFSQAVYQKQPPKNSKAGETSRSSPTTTHTDEPGWQESTRRNAPTSHRNPLSASSAIDLPPAPLSSVAANRYASSPPEGANDFRFVRAENLENPADALRILCAAAEDEPRANGARWATDNDLDDHIAIQAPSIGVGRVELPRENLWSRWTPVKEGILSAEEAKALVNFFSDHLNPTHPLVPVQMFQPAHLGALLREPILLAVIVTTSCRYLDLGLTFSLDQARRSQVIQTQLVAWLLQRIGHIAMGETTSRTVGTVEGLLVLSEWPPRPAMLRDEAMRDASVALPNPCNVYDDLSWTMVGLAVRIAQELDLQNERTYESREDIANQWMVDRRHTAWINCLSADRHASVRLGRASLVQEMSTCWWETLSKLSRKTGDTTFPFPVTEIKWRESLGVAELTHMIGFLQELLYATPQVTDELLKTGRYEGPLHRLKPELDSLWRLQATDLPSYSIFECEGETFTEDELREVRWRMEYDYVRLYANAIAMRAAQARLMRRHERAEKTDRVFVTSVMRSLEGPFVLEAVEAAMSLVKCGVTMQKKQVLRYCPSRVFLRLVFASVFLMKAQSFGAVAQPEQEMTDLQHSLIAALKAASVDDQDIAFHVATLLSRVFPAVPQPTLGSAAAPLSTAPMGFFDTGVETDYTLGIDWSSDLAAGFGYDPTSLVSDIEEMLASGGLGAYSFASG